MEYDQDVRGQEKLDAVLFEFEAADRNLGLLCVHYVVLLLWLGTLARSQHSQPSLCRAKMKHLVEMLQCSRQTCKLVQY